MTGKWKDGDWVWCAAFGRASRTTEFSFWREGDSPFRRQAFGLSAAARGNCEVLQDRRSPVNPEETLEMFAFMEAADESKAKGGAAVPLAK